MRELISNDESTCVGCNRCIRVCPVEGANSVYNETGQNKVRIDSGRCIACGACVQACPHGSRDYLDDTERFLKDLKKGVPISMFATPSNQASGKNLARLLTWLKQMGVRKIFDVSLGADINTWAHIRFIENENPSSIITQHCPAIVNYALIHKHELLPYLSPIHSPMLCTAIFMRKHENIIDKIAGLSPCIAKAHEFESSDYVDYNVTLKKLYEYVEANDIELPIEETGFDHAGSNAGSLYSMSGSLKKNIELHLGNTLRIDKSEGTGAVYKNLDMFSTKDGESLPVVCDVLNCAHGCYLGTGCSHESDVFDINTMMDMARRDVQTTWDKDESNELYAEFDRKLNLKDFIRKYTKQHIRPYVVTDAQIAEAFEKLAKTTETEKKFNCSACGNDTCLEMARDVACGLNIPENCIQKERDDVRRVHSTVVELTEANQSNIQEIHDDILKIRGLSGEITDSMSNVNTTIEKYSKMATDIDSIAMYINLISLNASVEAVRAGPHGNASSLVAEEINKLASSSKSTVSEVAQTTEEATSSIAGINTMIGSISDEIEKALENITDLSDKTENTLQICDPGPVEPGNEKSEPNVLHALPLKESA